LCVTAFFLGIYSIDHFHPLADKIKIIEIASNTSTELMAATVDYTKTRAVFNNCKGREAQLETLGGT